MSASLLSRLDRLEGQLQPSMNGCPAVIWVSFVRPGEANADRHVTSGKCQGRTFVRAASETAAQFQNRIEAETRPEFPTSMLRVVWLESEVISTHEPQH